MTKPCLLAYVENLYFQSQIEGIAKSKEIEVYFATQGEQLTQLAKTISPFMMIVDLTGLDTGWLLRHISGIRMFRPDFLIVAFIAHVEEAMRARAEQYGCNFVFTKAELIRKLPKVIEAALRKTI